MVTVVTQDNLVCTLVLLLQWSLRILMVRGLATL